MDYRSKAREMILSNLMQTLSLERLLALDVNGKIKMENDEIKWNITGIHEYTVSDRRFREWMLLLINFLCDMFSRNNAWFLGGAPPDWSDWPARAGSVQKLRLVSGRGLRMVSAGGRHTSRAVQIQISRPSWTVGSRAYAASWEDAASWADAVCTLRA